MPSGASSEPGGSSWPRWQAPRSASAREREDEGARAHTLRAGLATREMIGRAEGILMERERINSDEAFDILRRSSQLQNVKLREVARRLIETGERPPTA